MDLAKTAPHPRITLERANALELRTKYDQESFDIVYGISILEHIPNPTRFFSEVGHLLSKGGMAFLQGSPLWTGPWGHHINLTPWQDGTMGIYQFIPSQVLLSRGVKTFNPIPDWCHLIHTRDELIDILSGYEIPEGDVERILSAIYQSDVVNRESASNIVDAANNCGLKIVELEYDRVLISDELRERLRSRHGTNDDYSIMGVRLLLRKY